MLDRFSAFRGLRRLLLHSRLLCLGLSLRFPLFASEIVHLLLHFRREHGLCTKQTRMLQYMSCSELRRIARRRQARAMRRGSNSARRKRELSVLALNPGSSAANSRLWAHPARSPNRSLNRSPTRAYTVGVNDLHGSRGMHRECQRDNPPTNSFACLIEGEIENPVPLFFGAVSAA